VNRRRPTSLYRLFNKAGELLYIGIAGNVGRRMGEHSEKPWWLEVASITVEHHPRRILAELAEREAIKAEHPRYNVQHVDPEPVEWANRRPYWAGDQELVCVDCGRVVAGTIADQYRAQRCPECFPNRPLKQRHTHYRQKAIRTHYSR
jgi:DNA-directed RNA polymerase subunit RPC12/RpoP/predicted GIY-YIG superfamily endonuclease